MTTGTTRNGHRPVTDPRSADLIRALAQVLNAQARALAATGAWHLQIGAPFLARYPEDVGVAVEAINIAAKGVDAACCASFPHILLDQS